MTVVEERDGEDDDDDSWASFEESGDGRLVKGRVRRGPAETDGAGKEDVEVEVEAEEVEEEEIRCGEDWGIADSVSESDVLVTKVSERNGTCVCLLLRLPVLLASEEAEAEGDNLIPAN